MDKPAWYKPGKHPLGQVPVVQLGDFKGVESLVLADYLEEKYPDPRLGPRRPEDRAEEANLVAEFHRRVRRRKREKCILLPPTLPKKKKEKEFYFYFFFSQCVVCSILVLQSIFLPILNQQGFPEKN